MARHGLWRRLAASATIALGILFGVVYYQLWSEGSGAWEAVRYAILFAVLFGIPGIWFLWKGRDGTGSTHA